MYQGLDYIPPGIVCPEKGHKLEKLHINKWAEAETEKEQPEVSGCEVMKNRLTFSVSTVSGKQSTTYCSRHSTSVC